MTTSTMHDAETPCCEPWTSFERMGRGVQQMKRTLAEGKDGAERLMGQTRQEVQAHPMRTLAMAAAAGTAIGCLTGFMLGWRTSKPAKDETWLLEM